MIDTCSYTSRRCLLEFLMIPNENDHLNRELATLLHDYKSLIIIVKQSQFLCHPSQLLAKIHVFHYHLTCHPQLAVTLTLNTPTHFVTHALPLMKAAVSCQNISEQINFWLAASKRENPEFLVTFHIHFSFTIYIL